MSLHSIKIPWYIFNKSALRMNPIGRLLNIFNHNMPYGTQGQPSMNMFYYDRLWGMYKCVSIYIRVPNISQQNK